MSFLHLVAIWPKNLPVFILLYIFNLKNFLHFLWVFDQNRKKPRENTPKWPFLWPKTPFSFLTIGHFFDQNCHFFTISRHRHHTIFQLLDIFGHFSVHLAIFKITFLANFWPHFSQISPRFLHPKTSKLGTISRFVELFLLLQGLCNGQINRRRAPKMVII